MIDGAGAGADIGAQGVVGLSGVAGDDLCQTMAGHLGLLRDGAGEADAVDEAGHFGVSGQQAKVDVWGAIWAAAGHAAPAFGAQHAGVQADAVAVFDHLSAVAFTARDQVELDIGTGFRRV